MTRKKAIEAAANVGWDKANALPLSAINKPIELYAQEFALERAYDLGRIAGLKEAARIVRSSYFLETVPDLMIEQQAQRLEAKLK